MRDTLTALAILVIVVLSAALAAPYFIDWTSQRAFVEARLSHALGQKVTIGGAIDVKLLPTPYIVLDQAVIGSDDGPVRLGIRHLDLEFSVAPLLHGAFEVVVARLEEPTIRLMLQPDRTLPAVPEGPAFRADVRFDRIAVVNGTLTVADPLSGHTFALDHLDLDAEAQSLAGPFRATGASGDRAGRTKFRFATTTAQSGKTHAKLTIDETPQHPALDLDGSVSLAKGMDGFRESFAGTAKLSVAARGTALPWRLSGPIEADPQRGTLKAGEFRLGDDERGITLVATGEAHFSETPTFDLGLDGKQVDFDALLRPLKSADDPAPPTPLDLSPLRRLFTADLPVAPIRLTTHIATATLGGEAFSDLDAGTTLGAGGPTSLHLSGKGPHDSHIDVTGVFDKAAPSFRGALTLHSADAAAFLAGLQGTFPSVAGHGQDLPFHALDATADLTLDKRGGAANALSLRFGRSSLTGSARFQTSADGHPPLLEADLRAETLDLDALPDLARLRQTANGADLDVSLVADGLKVAEVANAPLDAGRLRLTLKRQGTSLSIPALHIENLSGATLDASAAFGPDGNTIAARLDATALHDAAALYRRLAPGAVADALRDRAAVLAPAHLAIKASFAAAAGLPRSMTIAGTLGGSAIDASLAPDPVAADTIIAKASASAPEGTTLLRQLGAAALPMNNLGAGRLVIEAKGPPNGSLATEAHATFGATTLDAKGHATLTRTTRDGEGTFEFTSPDISPLLLASATAFPDLTGRLPADLTGSLHWDRDTLTFGDLKGRLADDGATGRFALHLGAQDSPRVTGALSLDRLELGMLLGLSFGPQTSVSSTATWSSTPFGAGLIDPPTTTLDLKTQTLALGSGLVTHDARLTLQVQHDLVTVHGLNAALKGGHVSADWSIRRDRSMASAEGKLGLDHVAVDLPSLHGVLTGHLDLAGTGKSPQGLVSGLAGSGEATMDDLRIPKADPAALATVIGQVEADQTSVDEASVLQALDQADQAPLVLGRRGYQLDLAAGVLHAEPVPDTTMVESPGGSPTNAVSVALDLRRLSLDQTVEQTAHTLPKDWSGPPPKLRLNWSGPLVAPRRTLDADAFVNALAARALAREAARIEAFEFDARERAFFNERLRSDRHVMEDRQKVEDEARQAAEAAQRADEERRAKEAARLEKIRKAEAARAAQERAAEQKAARQPPAPSRPQAAPDAPATGPDTTRRLTPEHQPDSAADPSTAGRY